MSATTPETEAEITAASQRVRKAVRARNLARARLDKVPVLMDKMLTQMRELQESLPELTEGLAVAEAELRQAREENERALSQVHNTSGETIDDDAMAIVEDIQSQILLLQRQLECVRAGRRPARGDDGHSGEQHEHEQQQQQQQQQPPEHPREPSVRTERAERQSGLRRGRGAGACSSGWWCQRGAG